MNAVPFQVRIRNPHECIFFAGQLQKFVQAVDHLMNPMGLTSSGFGSNKDQQPLFVTFYCDPEDAENKRVTFSCLQNESCVSLTFHGLASLPKDFRGVKWICLEPQTVKNLYFNILSRSLNRSMKGVRMCLVNDSHFLVRYTGQLSTNTSLSSITDAYRSAYNAALTSNMLPTHLLKENKISVSKILQSPEWTVSMQFDNIASLQLFSDRVSTKKDQRVVLFGIEVRLPQSKSIFILASFKFNPDNLKDDVEVSYTVFAERVNIDVENITTYELRVLSETSGVPSCLLSAVENALQDSKFRDGKISDAHTRQTAAGATSESIFGGTSSTTNFGSSLPKTTGSALEQYLRSLKQSKQPLPRATLAFAILIPPAVFFGSLQKSGVKRGGGGSGSGSCGAEKIKFSFVMPKYLKHDAPLSAYVKNESTVDNAQLVYWCASTFMGGSSYSPHTLASEFLKQIDFQQILEDQDERDGENDAGRFLICHRVRRALERFTTGKHKSVFTSPLKNKKKRKLTESQMLECKDSTDSGARDTPKKRARAHTQAT